MNCIYRLVTEFKAKEYRLLYIVLFINGEQESLASLVLLAIMVGVRVRAQLFERWITLSTG